MSMHRSGKTIRQCSTCPRTIWKKMFYWDYKKDKVICDECARKTKTEKVKTFFTKLFKFLSEHGEIK